MGSPLSLLFRASLAIAVLGLVVPAVDAATFQNLYRVTVAPDPAVRDQRAAAIEAAMTRLLIRVTGNRNAPLDPTLQPMIRGADQYLNSYGLDLQGRPQVGFIASRVEQSLTSLGMPVWGPERPLTLVWIALDDGLGGRALLGANDAATDLGLAPSPAMQTLLTSIREELATVADERGLPLALPLLDLEDYAMVTFADVWGGFEDRVLAASQRYRADAILIGRVRQGLVGNEVQWLLVRGAERRVLAGIALRDGLDAAADSFAAELSTVGGASVSSLTILNVATSADYGRIMSHLERQSVLQAVDVESLENGVLHLRVTARGDAQVLERILALGGVLQPARSAFGGGGLVFEMARSNAVP